MKLLSCVSRPGFAPGAPAARRSGSFRQAIHQGRLFHSEEPPSLISKSTKLKLPWWTGEFIAQDRVNATIRQSDRIYPDTLKTMHRPSRGAPPLSGRELLALVEQKSAYDHLTEQVDQIFNGWKVTNNVPWRDDIAKLNAKTGEPVGLANYILDSAQSKTAWPAQILEILNPLLESISPDGLLPVLTRISSFLADSVIPPATVKSLVFIHANRMGPGDTDRCKLADHLLQAIRKGGAAKTESIELLGLVMQKMTSLNKRLYLIVLNPEVWQNLYSSGRQSDGLAADSVMKAHFSGMDIADRIRVAEAYVEKLDVPVKFQRLSKDKQKDLEKADDPMVSMARAIPYFFSQHIFNKNQDGKYEFQLWHVLVARKIAFQLLDNATKEKLKKNDEFSSFMGSYFTLSRQIFPLWGSEQRLQLLAYIFQHPDREPEDMAPAIKGFFLEGIDADEVKTFAARQSKLEVRQKLLRMASAHREPFSQFVPIPTQKQFSWRGV